MNPSSSTEHPLLKSPPRCPRCIRHTRKLIAGISNPNGSAGRPYYECERCGKFVCFADTRGIGPENPECFCCLDSRLQLAGPYAIIPRALFYVCPVGGCGFFEWAYDGDGNMRVWTKPVGTPAEMAALGF